MAGSRFGLLLASLFIAGIGVSGFGSEVEWACGYRLFPLQLKDGVFPHHYRPDRTVDFENLRLDIQIFMKEKRVEGTAHYTFRPIHAGVQTICFDAHEMDIRNVICTRPISPKWTCSENNLYVDFPESLPMDTSQTISIDYTAKKTLMGGVFGGGMIFTHSQEVEAQTADQMFTLDEPLGASAWFPCGDYPNDLLTTEVAVKIPKEFTSLSNGLLIESKEEGEWRIDRWRQNIPHATYLVSLVVGNFEVVRDEWRGIPVEYYVERGKEKDARPSMGKTPAMIEFFSNYLDYPYPYEKYAQVAVRYFTAGGMEHTTATTMFEGIVMDESARLDTDMEGLIMHELAHQWFGDLVTCESWPHLWLNEGFATLSDALWDEHTKGKDAYLDAILDRMEGYIGESRSYTRAIVTNRFENAGEMFDGHSYPKGACVLHMLRNQLGDDLFRQCLHNYLKRHAPGLVDTDDFQEAIERTTGRPMDRFFEQWVYRPGHPKLQAQHEWLDGEKQVKVTLRQTQEMKEGDPAFAFPLTIEVCTDDGAVEKTLDISKREESVFIDCPQAPRSVNVDPRVQVLMELDHQKTEDMLLYDLEKGSTVIVRIRAVRALAEHRSERTQKALIEAAQNDKYMRVRFEAIATLSKERTPEVRDVLLSLLNDPEPKIRKRAVNALEGFYKEKKAIDALIERFQSDPSNNIRADAARVLARLKPQNVYSILKPGFSRSSWQDGLQMTVIEALTDLEEPRIFSDLVRFSQNPFSRDLRTTAIRAMGRLAGKTKTNENKALGLLLDSLKSSSDAIRGAAIDGLQNLGCQDAIPSLRWVERNDVEKNIREAAGRAIAEIRKDRQSDLAGQNAGRIDKLEEENKKLENRIQELETKVKELTDLKKNEPSQPPKED